MSLSTYRRKRNFKKTAEPAPEKEARPARSGPAAFVIQKHDASRLHYDLRLEMGGAYKSWAVPKGLPFAKGEKHLAVRVEDHPLTYGGFEGTIPKGEYGGGTVMLWDRGTYTPLSAAPARDLQKGKLHFTLQGEKLNGEWYLVRLREGDQWLVIKGGEDMKPLSARKDDTSVLSGKNMKQLAAVKEAVPAMRKKTRKVISVPVPDFVEPMKARIVSTPPPGKWEFEIKFDGWRALILKGGKDVQLLSRNKKDFTANFPAIVEAAKSLPMTDLIIDGEIAALDAEGRSSFQLLQSYDSGGERPPLLFYAFDLLRLEGTDLTSLPLEERRTLLQKLMPGSSSVIKFSESLQGDARRLLKKAEDLGLEGLIGKRLGSVYEIGRRSGAWIKLKLHQEQEFVIGGYTEPTGSRQAFGAMIVGVYEKGKLLATGKVGTGFDTAMLRDLHAKFKKIAATKCPFANLPAKTAGKWGQGITAAEMKRCHWLRPKLVCQVRFSNWTSDGRLRQPVFLGLRPDKDAAEVVRETPA
jgi:bifunctional non-homologous end joining protein LigD